MWRRRDSPSWVPMIFIAHSINKTIKTNNKKCWISNSCDRARLYTIQSHKTFLKTALLIKNWKRYSKIISEFKISLISYVIVKFLSFSNGNESFWLLAKQMGQHFCSSNETFSISIEKAELFSKLLPVNCTHSLAPNYSSLSFTYRMPKFIGLHKFVKFYSLTKSTHLRDGWRTSNSFFKCTSELASHSGKFILHFTE